MTIQNNKLATNFILKLELPLARQRFYSEELIANNELADAIVDVLSQYKNIDLSIFDKDTMKIKIDDKKTLTFFVKEDALIPEEFDKIERTELKNGIKTQIILDVQHSVPGTEICIEVIKKLQERYPRSLFVDDANIFVGGDDIQKIRMNKKFMYDPDLIEDLENLDEIIKKYGDKNAD